MWTTPFDYGRDELARITAPAMVLVGDRDEVLPVEEATELYRRLPAGELAVVADADHGAFFDAKVARLPAAHAGLPAAAGRRVGGG